MPDLRTSARRSMVLLVAMAGCSSFGPPAPKVATHPSAELMNPTAATKIDKSQAADIQVALGKGFEDGGDLNGAEQAYRQAAKRDPKSAEAHDRLAIVLDKKGAKDEALAEFTKAHKLAPKDADILCDLGYFHYLQRRWAEAEENLNLAVASDPHHARSHMNLGLIRARNGDQPRALAEFALGGCNPSDAQANLGLVLAMEGHYDEAKKSYSTALAAKPKSAAAEEGLRAVIAAMDSPRSGGTIAGAVASDPSVRRASFESNP